MLDNDLRFTAYRLPLTAYCLPLISCQSLWSVINWGQRTKKVCRVAGKDCELFWSTGLL